MEEKGSAAICLVKRSRKFETGLSKKLYTKKDNIKTETIHSKLTTASLVIDVVELRANKNLNIIISGKWLRYKVYEYVLVEDMIATKYEEAILILVIRGSIKRDPAPISVIESAFKLE